MPSEIRHKCKDSTILVTLLLISKSNSNLNYLGPVKADNEWDIVPFNLTPEAEEANVTLEIDDNKLIIPESLDANTPILILNYDENAVQNEHVQCGYDFLDEKYDNKTLYYTKELDYEQVLRLCFMLILFEI